MASLKHEEDSLGPLTLCLLLTNNETNSLSLLTFSLFLCFPTEREMLGKAWTLRPGNSLPRNICLLPPFIPMNGSHFPARVVLSFFPPSLEHPLLKKKSSEAFHQNKNDPLNSSRFCFAFNLQNWPETGGTRTYTGPGYTLRR